MATTILTRTPNAPMSELQSAPIVRILIIEGDDALAKKLRGLSEFSPVATDVFAFGDVVVDFFKTEIIRSGERIAVTPKEFKMMEFLAKNAQRVISREELLDKVWGYENYPCTRTVDNHMVKLRQKLEIDPSNPSHFLTVHGLGYKFRP